MLLYPKSPDLLYLNEDTATEEQKRELATFAIRTQAMPPMYVYQLSKEALWGACKSGWTVRKVIEFIRTHATTPIPHGMQQHIVTFMQRYGQLQLVRDERGQVSIIGHAKLLGEIRQHKEIVPLLQRTSRDALHLKKDAAWTTKLTLARLGYPIADVGGNTQTDTISISLKPNIALRPYQREAQTCFIEGQESGVMVLPCGAGKTVVGVAIAAAMKKRTLVLVPGEAAAQQWFQHFVSWTNIPIENVAIDDGVSELAPITITTYQRLTSRRRNGVYHQFERYTSCVWGLVIYDEVHLLPAPLFRLCALLKIDRALGLSATLVREDNRTSDVFSLVGRKLFEVFADDLTKQGYLAQVRCREIRVCMNRDERTQYDAASRREKYRLAADNSDKFGVIEHLCSRHHGEQILIMGHYTNFLRQVSARLNCPMLDGEASVHVRLETYRSFREGQISVLVLSRIANMAVDLPNADVAIQVSGLFGSRQEEAQRLGRLLRPGQHRTGTFYSLVTEQSVEEDTARHRAQYLVEQGFAYDWTTADEFMHEGADELETDRMSQPRFRQNTASHHE